MSRRRRIVRVPCGRCRVTEKVDISDVNPRKTTTLTIYCRNNHKSRLTVRGGEIWEIEMGQTSDIDGYLDVPSHLREIIKEAYICLSEEAPKAGTCAVRLVLDDFLYEMNCKADRPLQKVQELESRCKKDSSFEIQWRSICRRIDIFKTIAGLGGYHAHPQKNITNVLDSEFMAYLRAVEGAVTDYWPKRSP